MNKKSAQADFFAHCLLHNMSGRVQRGEQHRKCYNVEFNLIRNIIFNVFYSILSAY